MEHLNDKSAHVTDEEKEKWNEKECSSSGSSDSSDDATSSTVIPTKISELENDVNFLTTDDMSIYATEEEVRSWLDGYQEKDGVSSGVGSGSGEGSEGDDDEVTDNVIISKFRIDPEKASLSGAKSIYLSYKDGKLSIKPFTAQTASLSVNPTSAEYGSTVNVTLTASYKQDEMQQVTVSGGNLGTKKIVTTITDTVTGITNPVTYTLNYTPKEDNPGTSQATVNVSKKYYTWYSSGTTASSIPNDAQSSLLTGKPGSISINAPVGAYTYLAFPKSWNVNVANFKVGGFSFGYVSAGECSGKYGLTNDYVVIRSAQHSLGNITITT